MNIKIRLTIVNMASNCGARVNFMEHALPTVWMQASTPDTGCGGCMASESGPRCRTHVTGEACSHPQLAGQQELVARVLQELNRRVVDPDAGRGIVDLQWVRALRIADGEAELTLSFAPVCGPAQELSESAFDTLRRLLPDTDVYVRHQV